MKGAFHKKVCEAVMSANLADSVLSTHIDDKEVLVYAAIGHLIVSKDLLMDVKNYLENDARSFYNFRKDNSMDNMAQLTYMNPHCFSTVSLKIRLYNIFQGLHFQVYQQ